MSQVSDGRNIKSSEFFHLKVNKMLILFLQFIALGRESYSLLAWPWGALWKSQGKTNLSFLLWFMWLFLGSILWNIILPQIILGDTYGSARQHCTFLFSLTPWSLGSKRFFVAVVRNYAVKTRKTRWIHELRVFYINLPLFQAVCQQLKFFPFSMGWDTGTRTSLVSYKTYVNCCM